MGAQLRVYRRRIRSVNSTKKITKAMELIAASRIVKAQARMKSAKPYAREMQRALAAITDEASVQHPMLTGVETPRRAGILLVTSDRGLAGGYNANAIRRANELAAQLEGDGKEVERYVIGRKGAAYFNFRGIKLGGQWSGFSEQPNFADARGATDTVVNALTATSEGSVKVGERGSDDDTDTDGREEQPGIDELWVVFTRFVNSVSQTAVALQVAPVQQADSDDSDGDDNGDKDADGATSGTSSDSSESDLPSPLWEFEPEPSKLLDLLLPRYISSRIFSALLESAASESAARRRAMKSASDNATELIKTFTRLANEARQAEITQEISEIVGGADALAATGSE